MPRLIILFAVSCGSLSAASLAQPEQPISVIAEVDQAIVHYADLDLASAAGKRVLDRRIGGAIEQVCGSFANVREASEEDRIIDCRSSARASANRQLAERPTGQRLALNIQR